MVHKWIPGYEGSYAVTDDGRVISYCCGKRSGKKPVFMVQTLSWANGHAYFAIDLLKDGKRKTRKVHQLVLEAFRGPRPSGMEGLHLDNNSLNNHLSNLEWGTHAKNSRMRNSTKLNEQKVRDIRTRHKQGWSDKQIAEYFGISVTTVGRVLSGQCWGDVR